jgi:hypothetical protein
VAGVVDSSLGSPTVRVEGEDVDPGAVARADYGLKCRRLYSTGEGLHGVPPDDWVLRAFERHRREAR